MNLLLKLAFVLAVILFPKSVESCVQKDADAIVDIFGNGTSTLPQGFALAYTRRYFKSPELVRKVAASEDSHNQRALSSGNLSFDRRFFIVRKAAAMGRKVLLRFNFPRDPLGRAPVNLHPSTGMWPTDSQQLKLFTSLLTYYLVSRMQMGHNIGTLLNALWPFGTLKFVLADSFDPVEGRLPVIRTNGVVVAAYRTPKGPYPLKLFYEFSVKTLFLFSIDIDHLDLASSLLPRLLFLTSAHIQGRKNCSPSWFSFAKELFEFELNSVISKNAAD